MSAILNRKLDRSNELWAEAQDTILSGCQLYSKGTETHIKGVSPIYIDRGKDAHVWDVDGTEYIDYDMGMGPVLLGYQYKAVDDAVVAQLRRGMGYSLVAPEEVEYAKLCVKHIPSAGKVRFLKTGSGATEAATRTAPAHTGRPEEKKRRRYRSERKLYTSNLCYSPVRRKRYKFEKSSSNCHAAYRRHLLHQSNRT